MRGLILGFGLIWPAVFAWAQPKSVQFQHLSPIDGLSQGTILATTQDRQGFMWFGTADGLNRYDGYAFRNFYSIIGDSTSLSNNEILSLAATPDGRVWVGTTTGLNVYDPEYDRFTRIGVREGLPNATITSLLANKDNSVWVGTAQGLVEVFPSLDSMEVFADGVYLPNKQVTTLAHDLGGNLWIGTEGGLVRMSEPRRGLRKFETIVQDAWDQKPIRTITFSQRGDLWVGTDEALFQAHPSIKPNKWRVENRLWKAILCTGIDRSEGKLWVGTNDGLYLFDSNADSKPAHFTASTSQRNSLTDNQLYSIFQGQDGIWWFGASSGLNFFDPLSIKFRNYSLADARHLDLVSNKVWAIMPDKDHSLWLGTEAGLIYIDGEGERQSWKADPDNPFGLQENRVRCLQPDPNDKYVWVGTEAGLFRYDPDLNRFKSYYFSDAIHTRTQNANLIRSMVWENGELWCGTENGIYIFDPNTEKARHIVAQPGVPNKLQHNTVVHFYQDQQGTMWVATEGGLHRRLGNDSTYRVYLHNPENPQSLIANNLRTIYEDSRGWLWIGTKSGLDRMVDTTGVFEHFGVQDGMPNHVVYAILEDDQHRLWMSTNRGLTVYNTPRNSFRNFDLLDGLQGEEYNTNASAKRPSGELFFGGINGYNAFFPDSLAFNEYLPPTYLVQIDVYGNPLEVGDELLPKSPPAMDTLYLTHKHDILTLHYTGLSYTQPVKNKYRYRLLGYDDQWIEAGTNRSATYTNLPGGTFIFEVRACNNDQAWNSTPTQLVIIVAPPFWDTNWFKTLTLLVVVIIAVAIFQQRVQTIERQKLALENTVVERTAQIREQSQSLAKQAKELRRNYTEVRVMADIGRQVTSHIKGMDLVKFLYSQLTRYMDVEVVEVGLYNPDRDRLEFAGVKAPGDPIPFHSHRLSDDYLTGIWCFNHEKPLLFNNYQKEYREEIGGDEVPQLSDQPPNSAIYVPFFKNEVALGFIAVHSLKSNAYSEFDFSMIKNLAVYIAIALDNSVAYGKITEQKEEIELMNENLEQKVRERTRQLQVQNGQLAEFAYLNAHKVRRPLASMMGLLQLIKNATDEDLPGLLSRLEVAATELDQMVHRMNNILTEQGILSEAELTETDGSKGKTKA